MILIFLDTETTGLEDDPDAEVIEYAFAEWDSDKPGDDKIVRIDSQLVMPRHGCPEEAAKINGYDPALWRAHDARPFGSGDVDNVLSYLKPGSLIAGSNPRFDINFLKREFRRTESMTYWPKIEHRYLNLASLAWPLWAVQEVDGVGLAYLTEYFSIEHKQHSAEGDVRASVAVWEALFSIYVDGPKRQKEALIEIGNDAREKGDNELAQYCIDHIGCVPWKAGS